MAEAKGDEDLLAVANSDRTRPSSRETDDEGAEAAGLIHASALADDHGARRRLCGSGRYNILNRIRIHMPRTVRAGRKARLLGERSNGQRCADEVMQIIRDLGGRERPIRFSEIYPKLSPPRDSKSPRLWRRISAERALNRLLEEGLIERTEEGYRDLGSPFFVFRGIRRDLDELILHASKLLSLHVGLSPEGVELVRKSMPAFGKDFASTIGGWLRAIDSALQEKARQLGIQFDDRDWDAARGAASVAQSLVTGYLIPEYVATGVLGDEAARQAKAVTDPKGKLVFPTPGQVDRWADSRGARPSDSLDYLWFQVAERFVGGEWPLAEGRVPGSVILARGEKRFGRCSNK